MRWVSWILVILICAATVGGLGFYKYNEIQAAIARGEAFPEPVEAVEIYVVERLARTPSLSVTGEVVARRSAELRMERKGRIVGVGFAPGARVEEGQTLIELAATEERAQLAEAQADREIAKLALERAERLVRTGAGSQENADRARAQYSATQARARALNALIERKTLRAPFAGIAGLHELEPGQYLDEGSVVTRIVGIADKTWIDFALPQEHAHVGVGSAVTVRRSIEAEGIDAFVIARDAEVNVRSRNLRLRAEIDPASTDLLPGMLVQVDVPLGEVEMATIVPSTSVRRDALGASVYILDEIEEDGELKTRARKRGVTLATTQDSHNGDWLVIAKGVQAGERIAGIGAFKLRDGSLVLASEPNPEAQERWVGH